MLNKSSLTPAQRALLSIAVCLLITCAQTATAGDRGNVAPASQVHLDESHRPVVPTPSPAAPAELRLRERDARRLPQPQPAPGGGTMVILDERFDQDDVGQRDNSGRIRLREGRPGGSAP